MLIRHSGPSLTTFINHILTSDNHDVEGLDHVLDVGLGLEGVFW